MDLNAGDWLEDHMWMEGHVKAAAEKGEKPEPWRNYRRRHGLSWRQRLAIELEIQGTPLREVAEQIGANYGTLRNWHSSDVLFQEEYAQRMRDLGSDRARRHRDLLEKACEVASEGLEAGDITIAKYVLGLSSRPGYGCPPSPPKPSTYGTIEFRERQLRSEYRLVRADELAERGQEILSGASDPSSERFLVGLRTSGQALVNVLDGIGESPGQGLWAMTGIEDDAASFCVASAKNQAKRFFGSTVPGKGETAKTVAFPQGPEDASAALCAMAETLRVLVWGLTENPGAVAVAEAAPHAMHVHLLKVARERLDAVDTLQVGADEDLHVPPESQAEVAEALAQVVNIITRVALAAALSDGQVTNWGEPDADA